MYVAFFKGRGNWLDFCIRKITKSKYSHVEFVLAATIEDGKFIRGACITSTPHENGVRLRSVQFDEGDWDFVEAPNIHDNTTLLSEAIHWYTTNKSAKYDWSGALGLAFKPVGQDKTRWFCSEAVAQILGFKDSWRYDPDTLYSTIEALNNK